MKIKTFRGKLADGEQQKIHLSGGDSDKGYRINKLLLMTVQPGGNNQEAVVKVYKTKETRGPTASATINFKEDTLMGAAVFSASANQKTDPEDFAVIFDKEVVNQDIYITHTDNENAVEINYYMELEQVKMSGPEQANVNFSAAILHGE